ISGGYMLAHAGGLARLTFAQGWWIDLMMFVWVLFALMLFVIEPLGLPAKLGLMQKARRFWAMHAMLLTLGMLAIACGVVGARGGF
ncbi:MAG TPA: hypothetical protein VFQ88_15895, partial [Nevskiaceae bacterium]|nr:hypothetical protein [Nevskiaceae bacterium]